MPPTDSARLREAGLRVTGPRLAVLSVLADRAHVDVETVRSAVHERLGGVSTQAVYDVLRAFTAAGLVRRIEPAGSPALFETRTGDNHHHIVCRGCGSVADVDCVVGAAPCLEPSSAPPGFLLDEAEVTFWGVCISCQSKNREGTTHT
ncbi:MAG TPA: Fur family transcriptional regulator [Mycobacteriales bacterium]|nr:Fur family transcriptional regulator [Mycobacteriales bacterium]